MNISMTNNAVYSWLLLLSILGWWLSHEYLALLDWENLSLYISIGVLILSLLKVRLIIMNFMEIKLAPWLLRFAFEAWLLIVFLAIAIPSWL